MNKIQRRSFFGFLASLLGTAAIPASAAPLKSKILDIKPKSIADDSKYFNYFDLDEKIVFSTSGKERISCYRDGTDSITSPVVRQIGDVWDTGDGKTYYVLTENGWSKREYTIHPDDPAAKFRREHPHLYS